jgi:hydroxyacylglutathione hydrolase
MLRISPIRAFDDNYIWLLRREGGRTAVVVDPGDEDPVLETLAGEGLKLGAILITHRHGDHTGGIPGLKAAFPDAEVLGPASERISGLTRTLAEGDPVDLPDVGARFRVLDVPGHTRGHIAYYGQGVLFCGDTLFAAGCGRVFDGTAEQLSASLARLAELPPETLVYCAHEYTLANLGFAEWVEPDNMAVKERLLQVRALRSEGRATVPSTLAVELRTNPFLRVGRPEVRRAAEAYAGRALSDDAETFAVVRGWKDRDYD